MIKSQTNATDAWMGLKSSYTPVLYKPWDQQLVQEKRGLRWGPNSIF